MSGDDHVPDGVDDLYRPPRDADAWAAATVDGSTWEAVVGRHRHLTAGDPELAALAGQGARLAAAHQSGALAGLYEAPRLVALALLGSGSLACLRGDGDEPEVVGHVAAIHAALVAAERTGPDALGSEDWIRSTHALACAPQVTHPVLTATGGTADHVLGHGDYKHHANHRHLGHGAWRAHAPVAAVRAELGRLAAGLAGEGTHLHPVTRAAYALHGLHHVAPFAAGNGRVARVLASGFLLRAGAGPLLIFAADRARYDGALAAAADGHPAPLVDLVLGSCVEEADLLHDVSDRSPARPEVAEAVAQWRRRSHAAAALVGL
ncbi:MAG: Fic family protein, partial [Acidimicrobiales bacterium]